jgi:hypothetical protein
VAGATTNSATPADEQSQDYGGDGVLRLQLTKQEYEWEFTAAPKGEVLDRGTGQCHRAAGPTKVR